MRVLGGLLVSLSLVFAGIVAMRDISSTDLGIHIRTGERIVSEAAIPATDTFSYTAYGRTWYVNQWAGQVLLYVVDRFAGSPGLVLLRVLLVVATFGTLLGTASLAKKRSELVFAVLTVLAIFAAAPRLLMRPFLFSAFFLAVTGYLLESWRGGRRDRLWTLVPLFALWSTIHPGFIYGAALVGCYVLGEWGARLIPFLRMKAGAPDPKRAVHVAVVFAASLAVPLLLAEVVLPEGARAVLLPLGLLDNAFFFSIIDEYQSADITRDRYFFLLLALSALALVLQTVRERRLDLAAASAIVLFGSFAVGAVRVILLFVVVALPFVMREFAFRIDRLFANRDASARALSIVTIAGIVWLSFWWRANDPLHGRGVDENNYPLPAFRFLESAELPGPLFHPERYGGPLMWFFGDDRRVYVDGRLELYGEEFWRESYFRILGGGPGWDHELDHLGINTLLLRRGDALGRDRIGALVREAGGWSLVYFDDVVMMYARSDRIAGRGDLVDLSALDPEVDVTPVTIRQELAMWDALYAWMPVRPSTRAYEISWRLLAFREDWEQIGGAGNLASIVNARTAPFFFRLRGDARFAMGRYDQARSDWERSGSRLGRSALDLFGYRNDRDASRLARDFEDRGAELARLASLLLNAGESDAAADLYGEAYSLSRSPYDANGRAWALLEAGGATTEALALAEEATRAEPSNGWFRGTLGRALEAAGRDDEAEKELLAAARSIPPDSYISRGKAFARLAIFYGKRPGREADAVDAGIEALTIDAKTVLRADVVRTVMNAGGEARLDAIMEQLCYDLGLGAHMGPEHAHMGHGDMPAELKYRLLTDAGFDPPLPEAPAHGGAHGDAHGGAGAHP